LFLSQAAGLVDPLHMAKRIFATKYGAQNKAFYFVAPGAAAHVSFEKNKQSVKFGMAPQSPLFILFYF
jgi:hypothetical protein